jgi:O-antigen/teichoic acid export membrane protein
MGPAGSVEVVVVSISSDAAPGHPPRADLRHPLLRLSVLRAKLLRYSWHLSGAAALNGIARARIAQAAALFLDGSEFSLARRLAGAAFLIRIASALIAFISQILLARWMGGFEFGVFVYAATWLLLIGGMVDFGLGSASQRLIPEYGERGQLAMLRGFLGGARWLALAIGIAAGFAGAAAVALLSSHIGAETRIPLYLSCAALPAAALTQVQSGVARSYNWVNLGLAPNYVQRQIVLLGLVGLAYALKLPTDATTATLASVFALWVVAIGQFVRLNRRLTGTVNGGTRRYAMQSWLGTAAPIFVVEGFYLLLSYSDIIVLQQYRPANDVATYYAAAKTLAVVAFIYYSVAQTIAHKFAEYDVTGDRKRLKQFLKLSIRLTFWPSLGTILVLLALGKPLLYLFGRDFVSGYYLMFIIAVGLLARAAVGPAERLLNMLGERRSCAMVYGGAFAIDLVFCVVLIPPFGITGAAVANALALVFESYALFYVAKTRLGLYCFIFGAPKSE